MGKQFLPQVIYLGCILAFIGGCAPTATNDSGRVPLIYISDSVDITAEQKIELLFAEAQQLEKRDKPLLDVAILFAQNGNIVRSSESLLLINTDNLDDQMFVEFSLLSVELNLQSNNPAAALINLDNQRFLDLQPYFGRKYLGRVLSIRSDINTQRGDELASISNSIALSALLETKADITNVHNKIWRQLARQTYSNLQICQTSSDEILAGWCRLAHTNRQYQNNQLAQRAQFNAWKVSNSNHPAALVSPSWFKQSLDNSTPLQVAILLPLQGQYKGPSTTFLDGFMEAYYQLYQQTNSSSPNLRIHDTSLLPIEQAYSNALAEGADMVIGGIRESEVQALMNMPVLEVPTISLNRIENSQLDQSSNLFQFGNSQRDEMDQIADKAWEQGHRSVFLVAPTQKWGQQATAYFARSWEAKGGRVVSSTLYSDSIKDFTKFLKQPLQIDLSEQRGVELRRFVNSQVIYTPRRRQDIDFVVVLGYPDRARQIKPALEFLYASDLPVYSSSKIYNGIQRSDLDRDLSGIQFTAMPWTFSGHLSAELESDVTMHTAYRQLYAMGYDTFLVHRNLDNLQLAPKMPLFGSTGILSLEDGVITRRTQWAEFQKGQARSATP
ncbi:penicillin-binding protein activator [Gammaproteobacteria bacterium]|nr:penicillin-binding protein activator [Gammaproteobacteria bacterium]|tara:strand:+ start:43 stop:1878 length:1836 start_codon:yes stop_codon:yes gene_type:complete